MTPSQSWSLYVFRVHMSWGTYAVSFPLEKITFALFRKLAMLSGFNFYDILAQGCYVSAQLRPRGASRSSSTFPALHMTSVSQLPYVPRCFGNVGNPVIYRRHAYRLFKDAVSGAPTEKPCVAPFVGNI